MKKTVKHSLITILLLTVLISCKKVEGPGGTSAISGYLMGDMRDGALNTIWEGPVAEERVYIIYGDEASYSESTRTDENGFYQFRGLTRGDYKIYAFSGDTTGGYVNTLEPVREEVSVTISNKKEVVDADDITIIVKP